MNFPDEEAQVQPEDDQLCQYRYKRCLQPRTYRLQGKTRKPHSLCEYHRLKQNERQKRSDARRREQISGRRRQKRQQQKQKQQKMRSTVDNDDVGGVLMYSTTAAVVVDEGYRPQKAGGIRIRDLLNYDKVYDP